MLIDYNNPNDAWFRSHDLTPDDQIKMGCFQMLAFLIILLALLSLCILLR
jgi:hypothetical protein